MSERDPLTFSKMAGGGNDFVVIDNRPRSVTEPVELTRRICTHHLSVGADGLILIESSALATFAMRYFNSDGSRGEFCANGTRCAARYAFLNELAGPRMTIETDAGLVAADIAGETVTLSLAGPKLFRAERPLRVGNTMIRGSSIRVGVPHYVIFTDNDLWSEDIVSLGRAIRMHPDLKADGGANVNFVHVRAEHQIEVRTYERGVEAETLSCGSGVVASVGVSALFGKVTSPVSVLTRSGITLQVAFRRENDELHDVRLTGDARLIYTATLRPEALEGFDPEWVRDPKSAEVRVPSE